MKMRKLLACVATCAIAASALGISCFAAITNATNEGKYIVDVTKILPEGCKLEDVYGAEFKFSGYDEKAGTGGGFVFSTKSNNWNQIEWGNEDAKKPISFKADDLTVRRMETTPFFNESEEYNQIAIVQWDGWGVDITIDSIVLLDKDGNALKAAAPAETTAAPAVTTAAPAATTAAPAAKTESTSAKTGVEGVAAVAAVLAVAGAAAVISRKKD